MAKIASEDHCDNQMQKLQHFQSSFNEMDDMGAKDFENPASLVKEYFESTTTHGLSRIYFARKRCTRYLWLIIFLVVFGLLVASICELIGKLTKNSVITNIKAKLHNGLELPAITFCNGVPFRESKLSEVLPKGFENHFNTPRNTEMKLAIGLSSLTDTKLKEIGHPKNIFLMTNMSSCLFQGKACNFNDFYIITTPVYGNCFTFNPKDRKQKKVDSASGLFTLLNINQDENIPGVLPWSSIAGVKVMVHHPNEIFPESQAIYLAPGTWTDIKIEKRVVERLPHPYPSNCLQKATMEESLGAPIRYTAEMCQYMCYVNKQNETCGYTTPVFSSSVKSVLSQFTAKAKDISMKYKIATEEAQLECLLGFDDLFAKGEIKCNCPPPCHEEQFKVTTSNAMWPPLNKAQKLLSSLNKSYWEEMPFYNWTTDTIYNNILAVNIYFNDFTVETVEQKQAYTMSDFVSDLGGQTGYGLGHQSSPPLS